MRKTKNFNIQVPELGDVPDITQVSNAIQDLEDALAGTLEIMDASIQGSGLKLSSVARQTKRTKYYDGMSMRFLCPQTISANTLKTVVVDDLPQQVITVPFDIIAGEYVDITYRGTSFTTYPVMIQKSESIDSNSNETVATSRAVKKINDKVNNEVSELDKNKVSKSGDIMTGTLTLDNNIGNHVVLKRSGELKGSLISNVDGIALYNEKSKQMLKIKDDGIINIEGALGLNAEHKWGATNFIGSLSNDADGNVFYGSYWSYDLKNEQGTTKFVSTRTNLNKKTILVQGYHNSGFSVLAQKDPKTPIDINTSNLKNCYKLFHLDVDKNEGYINNEKIIVEKEYNSLLSEINELHDGKENAFSKKSGFNLDKTDNATNDANKLFTAKGAYNLKNEVDTRVNTVSNKVSEIDKSKVSKSGDTMTGDLLLKQSYDNDIKSFVILDNEGNDYVHLYANGKNGLRLRNKKADAGLTISNDGNTFIDARNLKTNSKEVVGAVNELHEGGKYLDDKIDNLISSTADYIKFPDGTMLQSGVIESFTKDQEFSFPLAFISPPRLANNTLGTDTTYSLPINQHTITKTSFKVRCIHAGEATSRSFSWIAIGRWK